MENPKMASTQQEHTNEAMEASSISAVTTTEEEQEALFNTFPCSALLYYVQSPSTTSHANSSDCRHASDSISLSPFPADDAFIVVPPPGIHRNHDFTLSRYSSSRGSNNSFLHDKKITYDLGHIDVQKHGKDRSRNRNHFRVVHELEGVEEGGELQRRSELWRFVALDPSASCCCVAFQICWRFLVSLGLALLVFFLATRPPSPIVAFQISRVKHFNLGEGLDVTGVVTKILTCNTSVDIEIDNKSKLFGLHVHPATIHMAFGRLNFATSSQEGEESYVQSDNFLRKRVYVGVKNMPMYGAGRDMEDMLESGKGLLLTIKVSSRSSYHVVWNLIKSKYHHHAECLVVLNAAYDAHHHTQLFNSTCSTTTSHA